MNEQFGEKVKTIFDSITVLQAKDSDLKRDNANINGDSPMGAMLQYGANTAKEYNLEYLIKPAIAELHRDGWIHIHDLDFYAWTTTCTQIELRKLFKNGFNTGHGHLRAPKSIGSYAALAAMAVYSDDLPDGVDVMFNTNKKKGTPTSDVLKKVKDDPDNPFGSLIKAGGQSYYIDSDGNRQLSLINKRAEEGDWGEWADKLPSQFLSKQSLSLVNKQLNLAASDKMAEFDEICSLTNPTVKKSLLKSFADDCDSAAVHLQAAALPRQKYQVILPITSMKDNEV